MKLKTAIITACIFTFIALCAPRILSSEASGRQFYRYTIETLFEFFDSMSRLKITGVIAFAAAPGGNVCIFSQSAQCLYLFDSKGELKHKIDFTKINHSGAPLKISDLCVSRNGTVYLFELSQLKIISISSNFTINNFICNDDIFNEAYICPPVDIFYAGGPVLYDRYTYTAARFNETSLAFSGRSSGRPIPSSVNAEDARSADYSINFKGASAEISINSGDARKLFKTIVYPGVTDSLFLAEKNGSGDLYIGMRIINNDLYEYYIHILDAKGKIKNAGIVEPGSFPLKKMFLNDSDKLCTVFSESAKNDTAVFAVLKSVSTEGGY